ncbi:PREDICTED: uncharacterized protein LOC106329899 [Brassica oleracea var. oleracea]|nr:PREDICTED: uncharacterized protein LOC106329899 [Brassica oleracea var. oleracea]
MNPGLHKYLETADIQKWARVHFPGDRYNLMTTNIAESINKVISSSRTLPIVKLLDALRLMMTRWFTSRRIAAGTTKTTLTRGVEILLEKRVSNAKVLTVQSIDLHHSQVTTGSSLHIVNLGGRQCTCRRFDKEKLPCVHAIAAVEARDVLFLPFFLSRQENNND